MFLNNTSFFRNFKESPLPWLFSLGLILVFQRPSYSWLGWLIVAFCCWKNTRFGIYSIFFLASSFHSAEILKNPFLTIKHFHLAVLLFLVFYLPRHPMRPFLKQIRSSLFFFAPLWGLIILFAVHALFNPLLLSNARIIINWALVLSLFTLLLAALRTTPPEELKPLMQTFVGFFLLGVFIQTVILFLSEVFKIMLFNYGGFHNAHFGSLSVIAVFLSIAYWTNAQNSRQRLIGAILTTGSIAGTIFSLSRSTWFAFSFAVLIFLFGGSQIFKNHLKRNFVDVIKPFLFLLLVVIVAGSFHPSIWKRFLNAASTVTDPSRWEYTLRDYESRNKIVVVGGTAFRILRDGSDYVFLTVSDPLAPAIRSFLWFGSPTQDPIPGIVLNTGRYDYHFEIQPEGNEYRIMSNNFGFLGGLRRRDWRNLAEIFAQKPWLGEGLSTRVVGMHGLYVMTLAASGILGLSLLCFFLLSVPASLIKLLRQMPDLFDKSYALSLLAAIASWGIISLLETHFLQFYVWVPFVLANILVSTSFAKTGISVKDERT